MATARYPVVIEPARGDYSAYVTNFPGCIATGATLDEVELAIREAIDMHIAGLQEDGQPAPPPSNRVKPWQ